MNIGSPIDVKTSGELHVIKLIKKHCDSNSPIYIFDVGANTGQYTQAILNIFGSETINLNIFAFEPSKKTFELFIDYIKQPQVKAFNFGFGSKEEVKNLYFDPTISTLSSVYNRFDQGINHSGVEEIKINTIDNFLAENSIAKIHFLKMDIEGHELEALKGAEKSLSADKIDIIQFEFGATNIISRVFLKDFFEILQYKYVLYRILKNGLIRVTYSPHREIFETTIYLAVRKEFGETQ
jgi:FkbM family methyltransferase